MLLNLDSTDVIRLALTVAKSVKRTGSSNLSK